MSIQIKIISLEKHKNIHFNSLEDEYLKRLKKYCRIEKISIKRPKIVSSMNIDAVRKVEAEAVCDVLDKRDFLVICDSTARMIDSEGFAEKISRWSVQGNSRFAFVIGGPHGIHKSLKQKASHVLSFSKLTFGHELARLILCEVLYRSFDILHGGKYHK